MNWLRFIGTPFNGGPSFYAWWIRGGRPPSFAITVESPVACALPLHIEHLSSRSFNWKFRDGANGCTADAAVTPQPPARGSAAGSAACSGWCKDVGVLDGGGNQEFTIT